jgi:hypothetical protein
MSIDTRLRGAQRPAHAPAGADGRLARDGGGPPSGVPRDLPADRQAAWLHRTASNLAIDELRRRRLVEMAPLGERTDTGAPDTDRDLAAREAMGRLTAHERLVLLLRFEAGLTHAEIGALLDVSPEAARKRVVRARRRGGPRRQLHGHRPGDLPRVAADRDP